MSQPTKVVSQYPLPPLQYYTSTSTTPTPPPPPSSTGSYTMFGRVYTTEDHLPSLEECGRRRIYDTSLNPCDELRRLNKSLLENFLQLVDKLCVGLPPEAEPNAHADTMQQIEDLFVNMQHMINVMRPTQAAIDLKALLDRQTNGRKETSEKLKDSVDKALDLIGDAAERLSEQSKELSEEAAHVEIQAGKMGKKEDVMVKGKDDGLQMMLAKIAQIVADPTL